MKLIKKNSFDWPHEVIEFMADKFNSGHPVLQIKDMINKEFNTKLTKSSICSKISRLRETTSLITREKASQIKMSVAEKKKKRQEYDRSRRAKSIPRESNQKSSSLVKPDNVTPKHIPLLHLKKNQCGYAYGDGPYTFCGNEAKGLFCDYHRSICYQQLNDNARGNHDHSGVE